ncbi:hypothetical protein ACFTWF_03820 [Rhodococcus sp. NPDC056960]|uniref:hypothetical protein n=1 Tax=Rhodococcus sp. NPDC056960 TaxID=3345982 RepID=UPI003638F1D5
MELRIQHRDGIDTFRGNQTAHLLGCGTLRIVDCDKELQASYPPAGWTILVTPPGDAPHGG